MADTIPKKLFDAAIKESVYLDKYSAGLAKDVRKLLEDAQNEIVAAIAKNDPTSPTMTKWKAARLQKLDGDISTILDTKYGEIKKKVDSGLKKVGSIQAKNTVKSINGIVGVDVFNVTLTNDNVKAIVENTMIQGNIIGDWWDKQSDSVKSKLSAQMAEGTKAIQIGLVQGESVGGLISRVRGTALKPGIIAATKREATALIRTSVMQVANAVRQETYKKNSDVLDGIEWCSTLDSRTTPICMAADGKKWDFELNPIDHDMAYPGGPPCHFQCRSTTLPLLKSWNELIGPQSKLNRKQTDVLENMPKGMRDTINGPIPMNMNYNEWLLSQPISLQKEILGPGKWKLWSENKLTVSDLVDNSGRPLTIKELQAKLGISREVTTSFKSYDEDLMPAWGHVPTEEQINKVKMDYEAIPSELRRHNTYREELNVGVINKGAGVSPRSEGQTIWLGESDLKPGGYSGISQHELRHALISPGIIDAGGGFNKMADILESSKFRLPIHTNFMKLRNGNSRMVFVDEFITQMGDSYSSGLSKVEQIERVMGEKSSKYTIDVSPTDKFATTYTNGMAKWTQEEADAAVTLWRKWVGIK